MTMERIEVRYTYTKIDSAGNAGGNTAGASSIPYYHKYIVYTDSLGNQYAARGGTTLKSGGNGIYNPINPMGTIETEVGEYNEDFTDYLPPEEGVHPGETIAEGSDLSSEWQNIVDTVNAVGSAGYNYYPSRNSNSVVDTALKQAGLPSPTLDTIDDYYSPGSDVDLTELEPDSDDQDNDDRADAPEDFGNPPPNTPPGPPTPPRKPNREDDQGSPLVLDLDGDGVELYADGDYGTYFDLRNNGQAVLTGWVEPDDGLLAIDINGDGIINNISELFGTETTDGFSILKTHDGNDDGVIDSNDAVFNDLLIWTDVNSDGISQSSELHSLTDMSIASISVEAMRVAGVEIAGNTITHEATYTLTDGTERSIVDAWFSYDVGMTKNVADYDFDIRTAFMPILRGFGDLKDLHIAMSLDNGSETDSLLSQMIDLVANSTLDGVLSDWDTFDAAIETFLLTWAGVENVDSTSRGQYVDARHLEFNEALRGEAFLQYGKPNPLPEAGEYSEAVFDYLKTYYAVQLSAQIFGNEIFDTASYSLYTAGFTGNLDLLQTGIDSIQALAVDVNTDAVSVWIHFAQFLAYTKGLGNLTASEITALDTAVAATNEASLSDWQDVLNVMSVTLPDIIESSDDWGSFEIYYDNTVADTDAGNTVTDPSTGGYTNNELKGKGGDDTLYGLDGHDKIWGGTGNDTLYGGDGDDYLLGEEGDDIYVYESGNDTISEEGGNGYDEIRIAASTQLTEANLTDMYRHGDELILFLDTGDYITVHGYNGTDTRIEKIIFEHNNFEIDLTNLLEEKFYGTDGIDNLTVSGQQFQTLLVEGYAGNDVIEASGSAGKFYGGDGYDTLIGDFEDDEFYGGNHDDYLLGNGGDDILNGDAGNDILDGGTGNDTLHGGDGDDIFYYGLGYGDDLIERTAYNNDTVIFKADIAPDDLEFYRDNTSDGRRDLTITISSTGETLVVEDMFAKNNQWLYDIDKFEFLSDGTIWTNESIRLKYIADNTTDSTVNGDVTLGFESHDIFYSSLGDDVIRGYSGNDTYYWDVGAGNDIIYDQTLSLSNGSYNDRIIFENMNISDLGFQQQDDDLIITNLSTLETLTVDRQFYSNSHFHIEFFEFADGIIFSEQDVIDNLMGDEFTATSNIDNFDGGVGIDTVDYSPSDAGIEIDLLNNTASGGYAAGDILTSIENITGSDYNDQITGDNGDNVLSGGAGNDILMGGLGNDTYYYTSGNDTIVESGGNDVLYLPEGVALQDVSFLRYTTTAQDMLNLVVHVDDGDGDPQTALGTITIFNQFLPPSGSGNTQTETLRFQPLGEAVLTNVAVTTLGSNLDDVILGIDYGANPNDTIITFDDADIIASGDGQDTIFGGSGNDSLSGQADGDALFGEEGDDWLYGGTGNDYLFGDEDADGSTTVSFGGSDHLYGEDGNDWIEGNKGHDFLYGGNGVDILLGGEGNDTINGNTGDDFLQAGVGNDTLTGGTGQDDLYGEGGADTFTWLSGDTDAVDNVYDFSTSEGDVLDISNLLTGYTEGTSDITEFVQITDGGTNSTLAVDVDGGGDNFVTIATLYGLTGETATSLYGSGNLNLETV